MEPLSPEEVRVVASLVEKEATTPDAYPLTMNSLILACNQSSNRHPVVNFDESTVIRALDGLRRRGMVVTLIGQSGRVPRYRHKFEDALDLDGDEAAVLATLALRGPQTAAEIRSRSERLRPVAAEAVEAALDRLRERGEPLVARLERQPGQKELRWAHLLSGEPDIGSVTPSNKPAVDLDRLAALEARVASLEAEMAEVRALIE